MNNNNPLRLFLLAFIIVGFMQAKTAFAGDEEEQSLRNAVSQFYSALNVLFTGDSGPMQTVWSHAQDVVYMGPGGGLLVGWEQVLADWEAQANMKLGGKVEPEEMHIVAGPALAVVYNYERGENSNAHGKPQQVSIRATNLFRKEHGKWKMIGHHTDLLPYLQK